MVQFDRLPRMNWSHQIVWLIVWEPPQGQRQPMRGRQEIDRASMSFEILMISDCTWLYLFINLWNADVRCYDCMWHYLIELTHNYNHVKNQSNQYTPKNQINLKPTSTKSMKTGRSQRNSTGTSRKGQLWHYILYIILMVIHWHVENGGWTPEKC